jgi:hypothetical protein
LHPDIENAYLETIEPHCKYKEPDAHESEILRLLTTKVGEEGWLLAVEDSKLLEEGFALIV